ncbi:hypothetical protein ACROYT_G020670 [Oculina patagonica]
MTNSSNSSVFDDATSVHHIVRSIWLSFVFVFGTVGNLLLFAVILRKGRIANVTNLFNLNLAVGDLIRIFFFIPVYLVYSAYGEWPPGLGLVGCKVLFMLLQSSLTVSIVTLMFMSMERYQAVVHPLKKQMTIRLARFLVVISWALGFLTSFWYALALNLDTDRHGHVHCSSHTNKTWVTKALLLLIPCTQWLPGVVFTIAYVKIILKLRRTAVINPSDVTQSSQNRHRRNMRAIRILIIEVVLFLGCLFPFYKQSLAMTVHDVSTSGSLTIQGTIMYCLMMTYSLINPFCHILLNTEFRGEIVKMVCQLKAFCHLRTNRVNECSHCHLPGWHLKQEETTQNIEKRTIADMEL